MLEPELCLCIYRRLSNNMGKIYKDTIFLTLKQMTTAL